MRLLTHLVVREDAHMLYGFGTEDERALFRSLLKVSGVGPKIALAILSGVSVDGFARCVRAQDAAALTRIPGVGRKTAERLIVEMRDRLDAAGAVAGGGAAAAARRRRGARRAARWWRWATSRPKRRSMLKADRRRRHHRRPDPPRAAGRGARVS